MDWNGYLVDILREEVASREDDLSALRNSAQYRVGGWVLQIVPVGWQTVRALKRLIGFYLKRITRGRAQGNQSFIEPEEYGELRRTIVFGSKIPEGLSGSVWVTESAEALNNRLSLDNKAGTLIIRNPAPAVLRMLERAKLAGWVVVWSPAPGSADVPAMVAYARAHCEPEAWVWSE